MNKFTALSLISIVLIALFFFLGLTNKPQQQNELKNAFHKSLKSETSKKYQSAIDELQKYYNSNKNNYILNLRLGWLHYLKGDYSKSKSYYSTALNLKNNIESNLALTLPLAELGEWEKIKELYQNVLKMDVNNYTANLRLGQIYLNSSDLQNAKKYLEKVIGQYPSEYEPNLSLGWTYYYLGDNNKAQTLLTNAVLVNASDSLAQYGLNLIK